MVTDDEDGDELDPRDAEPVVSSGSAQATQRRAAKLRDISPGLGVVGERGIDGGERRRLTGEWGTRGEGEAERERDVEWGGDPRRRGAGDLIPSAGTARWCDGDAPLFILFMARSEEQGAGKGGDKGRRGDGPALVGRSPSGQGFRPVYIILSLYCFILVALYFWFSKI